MANMKLIAGFGLVAVLCAGIAGGAVWYLTKPAAAASGGKPEAAEMKEPSGKQTRKYLTLDKVIVMLRRGPNDSESHYLSADLVIATTEEKEKRTKEQMPLLRSIAVSALASFPADKAQMMTIEEFAEHINKAFNANYEKEHLEKPFSEVMIGKLIIE